MKTITKIVLGTLTCFTVIVLYVGECAIYLDTNEGLVGATMEKDHARMRELLRAGADVNYLFMGTTPSLQEAIENDDAKGAAILLEHGASIDILEGHYQRLLESAHFRRALAKEGYILKTEP